MVFGRLSGDSGARLYMELGNSEKGWCGVGVLLSPSTDSGLCGGDIIGAFKDENGASGLVGLCLFESPSSPDDGDDGNGGSGEGGRFTVTGKSILLNRISSSIALLLPRVQLITPSSNVWHL